MGDILKRLSRFLFYNIIIASTSCISLYHFNAHADGTLHVCNITKKPVSFAVYYIDSKGYAIKYDNYVKPVQLPPQQQLALRSKTLPFVTVPFPGKKCASWGLAGKSADCRDYFSRVIFISFNNQDIASAGHLMRNFAGDPSLNSVHDFNYKQQNYCIFFNVHGFDPVYAASSGREAMDARDLERGKLNMVKATEPVVSALQDYILFEKWMK